jgi:5-carboxymethyl-2-hydroxymuconate isomerase
MPHTIIEHSFIIPEAQASDLLLRVNQGIAQNEGDFDIAQCKARTLFCQNFVIGDNSAKQDFMHITIRIMAGRSVEIRKKLSENISQIAGDFLEENNLSDNVIALSVDIVEIVKETYQKNLVNPDL